MASSVDSQLGSRGATKPTDDISSSEESSTSVS